MNLAYPVATPEIKEKYMGLHGNFEINIQTLRSAGYGAIELFTCNPEWIDRTSIKSILINYGIDVAAVGTSHLMNLDGLSLICPQKEIYDAAVARLHSVIQFASVFSAPVSIGKFRGNISELHNPGEHLKFVATLKAICAFAAQHGIDILIEPQNRSNINNVNSVADACVLLEEVNMSNLRLHLDTFHLDLTEENPAESIRFVGDKIGFIHLSDSERKIPGEGCIYLVPMLKTLLALSYDGYLSFEIDQRHDPIETAQKAFSKTSKILERLSI